MSLKHSSNLKGFNQEEELIKDAFEIVESKIDTLINEEDKKDCYGKRTDYQRGNTFYYVITYLWNVRKHLLFLKQKGVECPEEELYCKYKMRCIEENLRCLSSNKGTDYINPYFQIKLLFGIPENENCEDCCEGIGQMEIGSLGCNVFEVNKCN